MTKKIDQFYLDLAKYILEQNHTMNTLALVLQTRDTKGVGRFRGYSTDEGIIFYMDGAKDIPADVYVQLLFPDEED